MFQVIANPGVSSGVHPREVDAALQVLSIFHMPNAEGMMYGDEEEALVNSAAETLRDYILQIGRYQPACNVSSSSVVPPYVMEQYLKEWQARGSV